MQQGHTGQHPSLKPFWKQVSQGLALKQSGEGSGAPASSRVELVSDASLVVIFCEYNFYEVVHSSMPTMYGMCRGQSLAKYDFPISI